MKMKYFMKILISVLLVNYVVAEELDDDTVVIEAEPLEPKKSRHARQIYYRAQANAEGSSCLTSGGILGSCTSFKTCYPYFKFPDLNAWDSWVVGNYDTCRYTSKDGRQAFGVCCTNPITPSTPATTGALATSTRPSQAVSVSNNNPYPHWPPPLITHPPDHTAATHPVYFGQPASTKPTITTTRRTTRRTTTWPTKPPVNKPQQTTTQWLPPIPTYSTTNRPQTTTTRRPQFITTTPAQDSSNEVAINGCGAKNGNPDQERIVGGHNADPNEWPWIAVLFNGAKQFCGGSLIDDRHILGAAHCVAHMSSWDVARLTVRLGDYNIKTNTEIMHVERKIKRIVRHKGFDSRTLYNDIAILTLDQPVTFTKAVHPVCLPSGSSRLYNGKTGVVVGWGSLRENGPQPAILQEVTLPIWTNNECAQKYGPAAPGGIIESMLCAGLAAKDSCSGDSGGPLVVNEGNRWTQIGIVSWGIGCGKGQYPGVYSRVTSFMNWITKNTKDY